MPPLTEQAPRTAVGTLDLAAAVRFEAEFHEVWQEAVQRDSTVPLHTFLYRWGVFVALHRFPRRAARLDAPEREVAAAGTAGEARTARPRSPGSWTRRAARCGRERGASGGAGPQALLDPGA
jgi:hypothetical protein